MDELKFQLEISTKDKQKQKMVVGFDSTLKIKPFINKLDGLKPEISWKANLGWGVVLELQHTKKGNLFPPQWFSY